MSFALANVIHLLSALVWVGGMFFAYVVLRPAAGALDPPQRLQLWAAVFGRFFPWVWAAIILLLLTGYWMVINIFGGFASSGVHIHIMHAVGLLMMLLFLHLFFAPYRRLKQAVDAAEWPEAGRRLAQIRLIVAINLSLGLIVVIVAAGGRLF
jgi:uncharacterized membrane protein